jgi:hypothetical protein
LYFINVIIVIFIIAIYLNILLAPVHVYGCLRGLNVVWASSRDFVCDSLDLRLNLGIRIIGFNKISILYKNVNILY